MWKERSPSSGEIMRVIIAGLEIKAGLAYIGDAFPLQYDVQWHEADEFFAKAEDEVDGSGQWVWLYRAPWALSVSIGANTEVIRKWQNRQRRILQLRRHLRNRLVLVNVDRTDAHALAQRLGMGTSESSSCDSGPITVTPMVAVLGTLFEQIAPDYWTLYEALEAASWLPQGEPEFRSTRAVPLTEGLELLLDTLHAGQQMPQMLQRLQKAETREQQAIQESEASRQAAMAAEAACQTLTEAQQRLQAQVNDSIQQLEEAKDEVQQLAGRLGSARDAVTQSDERCEQLEQERNTLEKQLADSKAKLKVASEESEALLIQLHQVQEELEKYYLNSAAMEDAYAQLKQQLDQSFAIQTQLIQERDLARQATNVAEASRKKLADEQAILQKRLAQERDVAHKATAAAEAAHKKLSDEQAHLQKQLTHERDIGRTAAAQHEDARKKMTEQLAGLQKQSADDAKRFEEAVIIQKQFLQERDVARKVTSQAEEACKKLTDEQVRLQKQLSEANAAAKSAQEESELLLSQLHQVQEELESYYLANRQMLTVMEQSETTMDRARKALIRLAHG